MSSLACDRFRDGFEPGEPLAPWASRHRAGCSSCAAHARELEWVSGELLAGAGADFPLPAGLERRLRSLADRGKGRAPDRGAELQPSLPMPPGLASRLRAIGAPPAATAGLPGSGPRVAGREAASPAPRLPWWLASTSASLAASLLLALLTAALLGNPVTRFGPVFQRAQQAGQTATSGASLLWQGTATSGELMVSELWSRTTEEARKSLAEARGSWASLSARLELAGTGKTAPGAVDPDSPTDNPDER